MILNLAQRVKKLEAKLSRDSETVDMACFFRVVARADGKRAPQPTGESSQMYGGAWSDVDGEYLKKIPRNLQVYDVTKNQFDFIESTKSRPTGKGGRGSGKSEALVFRAIKNILKFPGENGRLISPVNDLTLIIIDKLFSKIPTEWVVSHSKTYKETVFANGASVQYRSAKSERALRSWGGSWTGLDEEADIPEKVVGIAWGCLRLTDTPEMFGVGTPVRGEYEERYKKIEASEDGEVFTFPSRTNCFIPHRVFELMLSQMDDRLYRQEVLGEFVDLDTQHYVFYGFNRAAHCIGNKFLSTVEGVNDVTEREIERRTRMTGRRYLIGVDYNWGYPNYAVVIRIYEHKELGVAKLTYVTERVISSEGHAGTLATAIVTAGFKPSEVLVIDDASGEYNAGKGNKRSSALLMRSANFTVMHPARNPGIKLAVDAINCKLSPADESPPRLLVTLPQCEHLASAMEGLVWHGEVFDKRAGLDHVCDALKYAVHFFAPAARMPATWEKRKAA